MKRIPRLGIVVMAGCLAAGTISDTVPGKAAAGAFIAAAAAASGESSRQVEPRAGRWKTWLLSSPGQFRPQAPPNQTATGAELKTLESLAAKRYGEARLQIEFWTAGGPLYR